MVEGFHDAYLTKKLEKRREYIINVAHSHTYSFGDPHGRVTAVQPSSRPPPWMCCIPSIMVLNTAVSSHHTAPPAILPHYNKTFSRMSFSGRADKENT